MSELTDKLEELRILSRVDPQYLNKEYFDQLFSECIALSKAPLPQPEPVMHIGDPEQVQCQWCAEREPSTRAWDAALPKDTGGTTLQR